MLENTFSLGVANLMCSTLIPYSGNESPGHPAHSYRLTRAFVWNVQADQSPVVQSLVSLTSSLRVILLTVLVDSIYNILIFFAEKI